MKVENIKMGFSWLALVATIQDTAEIDKMINYFDEVTLDDLHQIIRKLQKGA